MWLSYLFTGALVLIASWVLQGCRFGNHLINQPTDPVAGFYETQAQALEFSTTQTSDQHVSAQVNMIPSLLTTVFTDPVYLASVDSSGNSEIISSDGTHFFPIGVFSENTLYNTGNVSENIVFADSSCVLTMQIDVLGSFAKSNGPFSTSNLFPVVGRIGMTVTVEQSFNDSTGTCVSSLQAMQACYESSSNCSGVSTTDSSDPHTQVVNLYYPFISAGAMKDSDIPMTTHLSYVVTYQ